MLMRGEAPAAVVGVDVAVDVGEPGSCALAGIVLPIEMISAPTTIHAVLDDRRSMSVCTPLPPLMCLPIARPKLTERTIEDSDKESMTSVLQYC